MYTFVRKKRENINNQYGNRVCSSIRYITTSAFQPLYLRLGWKAIRIFRKATSSLPFIPEGA